MLPAVCFVWVKFERRRKNKEIILISSVGRVAQSVLRKSYGLEGPGSNPGWDEIFRQSRPALGPTKPPVKWVPGLSRG